MRLLQIMQSHRRIGRHKNIIADGKLSARASLQWTRWHRCWRFQERWANDSMVPSAWRRGSEALLDREAMLLIRQVIRKMKQPKMAAQMHKCQYLLSFTSYNEDIPRESRRNGTAGAFSINNETTLASSWADDGLIPPSLIIIVYHVKTPNRNRDRALSRAMLPLIEFAAICSVPISVN